MLRRLLAVMLSVGIALWAPAPIWAQAPPPKFEDLSADQRTELARLVDQAKGAYNRGEFADSLRLFQAAFDIFPHPDILYRMGLCYERLEEYAEAVRFYELFLAQVPDAPERPRIEKIIESLSSRISKSKIAVTTVPDGAIVYINSTSEPSGTTPTDFPVAPGTHLIIVKKVGYLPVEEQVTVQAGETMQLRYQLRKDRGQEVEAKKKDTPAGPDNTSTVITLAAVGIGATITSIVFFSLYSDKRAEVDELESQDKQLVSRERLDDAESAMYTNLAVGVISGAVAAGTLLWAYLIWKDDNASASVMPAPTNAPVVGFGKDGWEVGWTWSF